MLIQILLEVCTALDTKVFNAGRKVLALYLQFQSFSVTQIGVRQEMISLKVASSRRGRAAVGARCVSAGCAFRCFFLSGYEI
jgi:hypothetical protein